MALLDIFLAFFLLLAVHCIVADRQWFRARLMTGGRTRLLFRPWLLAAGLASPSSWPIDSSREETVPTWAMLSRPLTGVALPLSASTTASEAAWMPRPSAVGFAPAAIMLTSAQDVARTVPVPNARFAVGFAAPGGAAAAAFTDEDSAMTMTVFNGSEAAALIKVDNGGGIVEQSIGPAAPWFILGVMIFSYAVRWVYIESCTLFVRGGVYRVVKTAMGGFLAKLAVSALIFDYLLTGPISSVSAGQYIIGLGLDSLALFAPGFRESVAPHRDAIRAYGSVLIACCITIYFFRLNLLGRDDSTSGGALETESVMALGIGARARPRPTAAWATMRVRRVVVHRRSPLSRMAAICCAADGWEGAS